jgi:hypothetical protein
MNFSNWPKGQNFSISRLILSAFLASDKLTLLPCKWLNLISLYSLYNSNNLSLFMRIVYTRKTFIPTIFKGVL